MSQHLRRDDHDNNNYIYMPSLAGACISCVIFAAISIALSIQLRRYRVKYPMILPIGAACESIGYFFRALGASGGRETNFALFLLMSMFVILSPLAFMAGLYVIYGRLVRRLIVTKTPADEKRAENGPGTESAESAGCQQVKVSPLPGHWYARTFVACDITSFLIQAAGAGLIVSSNMSTADRGKSILMAGLGVGFATFAGFIALVVYSNMIVNRAVQRKCFHGRGLAPNWRTGLLLPLGLSALCIVARTIYRIIEFAGGYDGHIYTTEWYLYVFDTTLMVICITVWIPFFPAKYGLDQSLSGIDSPADLRQRGDVVSNNEVQNISPGNVHHTMNDAASSKIEAGNTKIETINVV